MESTVDYGFMAHVSELLVCSRCLRHGIRAQVRQVVSKHHRPVTLCPSCRGARAERGRRQEWRGILYGRLWRFHLKGK
jgi:hypothetical protein